MVSPGGIEAWLVEEHAVPIISLRFAFRGGAKLDPPGREGLAEFVTGMLNEGAGEWDSLAFQTELEAVAASMSFDAGIDRFSGSVQTLTETGDRAFTLLAAALADVGQVRTGRIELLHARIQNVDDIDIAGGIDIDRRRGNDDL